MAEKKKSKGKMIYESKASLYERAVNTMNADRLIVQYAFKIENYLEAAEMFEQIKGYKDSDELAESCLKLVEQAKKDEVEYRYQLAIEQKEAAKGPKGYEKAEKMLKQVLGYKDADQLLAECTVERARLLKKRKAKKLVKFCGFLLCVAAVVVFLKSAKWNVVQEQILEWNQTMTEVAAETEETELGEE